MDLNKSTLSGSMTLLFLHILAQRLGQWPRPDKVTLLVWSFTRISQSGVGVNDFGVTMVKNINQISFNLVLSVFNPGV